MDREDFLYKLMIGIAVVVIVFFIAITVLYVTEARQQPKAYQIDTTKVQVLYEDTWGKIIIVKEEQL